MTGSAGQKRVPKQFLSSLLIPLPPLDEQRRIAAILDQADSLRLKQKSLASLLSELPSKLFVSMFGDPVINSKKWPTVSLAEVGALDRGVSKHRPRNDPDLLGGPYPLIQTGDIANADGYIREYHSTYSEKGLKQSRLWPAGTLCVTIAANIGKTAILTFDACFPDSVVGFVPNGMVTTEYVQTWMSFLQKRLEDDAPQFAQKNINLAILRGLDMPVPPIEIQSQFARAIAQVTRMKEMYLERGRGFEKLFASLQRALFDVGGTSPQGLEIAAEAAE